MSRVNMRGGDASLLLPSSDSDAREPGSTLDGMGSASSLNSTSSSVFSANAHPGGSNGNLSGVTPLTHPDSSPLKPLSPFPGFKSRSHLTPAHASPYAAAGVESPRGAPTDFTPHQSPPPPLSRSEARPPPGAVKGYKAIYDSELDNKLSKDGKKREKSYKTRVFGNETIEPDPPPDPRLVIVGYTSGNCVPKTAQSKTKLRIAPYSLKPYPHDSKHSIGPGQAQQVVIHGYDPFTPVSQLRTFFSSYGEIAELKNQTDPATGTSLGICLIRYRDSRSSRGPSVLAVNAAKRAEKESNGEKFGINLHKIRVERDREGRKCRSYVESILRRKRKAAEIEGAKERARQAPPPPPPAPSLSERIPSTAHTPRDASPIPPPNAPRGPAVRASAANAREGPASTPVSDSAMAVESQPILSKIKRKPYVFISEKHVPVLATTIPHMKKRFKAFDWRDVRADKTGYYVIFEDSKRGEDEAVRCHKEMNGGPMFTHTLVTECQQYGNPDYERSPSPETQANEMKRREEHERMRKDEEADLEEEKRQRANNLDPVRGALEQLQIELRKKIMDDVKERVTIPTIYDCLDPARHAAKRRKLDLPDPDDNENKTPSLLINKAAENGAFRNARGQRARPLRPHDPNSNRGRREQTTNVYADERRAKRPPRPHARPLHFQLQDMAREDEDSDDEHRTSFTRDTEDQESRPLSRASRTSTPFGDSESVAESNATTPHKKRKLEHKESTWEAEEEQEEFTSFHKEMLGDILRKIPEGMAKRELELVISTLPRQFNFAKRCRTELFLRMRTKETDDLFKTKGDETDATSAPVVDNAAHDVSKKTDNDKIPVDDQAVKASKEKSKKKQRKTKKQIFEEREALKKAAQAIAESQVIEDDAISQIEEMEKELDEDEEMADLPAKPQVEWAVSSDKPRPTVEDDLDMVLDIDGWQSILKDDEDVELLKKALEAEPTAALGDAKIWAWQQKEIKSLNTGGVRGPVHADSSKIQGYYVPNPTGSARTEGVQKILNSEKSKYLPHRIKVQKAREAREAQANDTPAVAAEKIRQEAAAANNKKFTTAASSRTNRANNRRLVNDINLQKQTLATAGVETDAVRFNQLKKRKKLVKFDRSAIHGWGLYAMENIAFNDMIIEYVGEKVRQKVADLREERYDKQGIGSSYLFRLVEDEIVDATKKGGIARFINHSCSPNCTAKIIKVEGTRRIVIYAMKDIAKNEELTYDYKFEREYGSTDRIPCLCGSAGCKGFLN